jgi:cyclopropane-fatty-acyl-phospholipid synthase
MPTGWGSVRRGLHRSRHAHAAALADAALESHCDEFVALQGEEVARAWRLYLAGGRLAFEEGRMGVDQIRAVKAGGR